MRRKIGAVLSAVALSAAMVAGAAGQATADPAPGSPSFKECAKTEPPNANADFSQDQTAQCDSSGDGVKGPVKNSQDKTVPGQN
jgi:hypothetical protein